jgi:hypothetical protein
LPKFRPLKRKGREKDRYCSELFEVVFHFTFLSLNRLHSRYF